MNIKEAMASYFYKLNILYKSTFGTLPTVSWNSEQIQDLFLGKPDEDDEIQWQPLEAKTFISKELCNELKSFYGSYYYWELRGEYQGMIFNFPPILSSNSAKSIASIALADGEYYFPNQNTVLLATCSANGNDDLLLFYRQQTGELFVYETDKRFIYQLDYSLVELISSMKAVI